MDQYRGSIDDPLSLNRYAYCNNDPINFVDPSGFFSWSTTGIGIAEVGLAVGGAVTVAALASNPVGWVAGAALGAAFTEMFVSGALGLTDIALGLTSDSLPLAYQWDIMFNSMSPQAQAVLYLTQIPLIMSPLPAILPQETLPAVDNWCNDLFSVDW